MSAKDNSNQSFLAAMEKAKAVAAKLTSQLPDSSGKRYNDQYDDTPSKKFASVNDAVGAQLAMFKAQNLGGQDMEEIKVPDNKVGLIIGKGGDQLHRLQNETLTKIIIAQADSNQSRERTLTISGNRENIERCKKAIDEIVRRGASYAPNDSASGGSSSRNNIEILEIMIPGNKCGLIIGKGGETIKRLSEQHGVKLVVVQDPDTPQSADKPLRITGEPDKVTSCKESVLNLINGGAPSSRSSNSTNDYGSRTGSGFNNTRDYGGKSNHALIKVPFEKAGLVIGKGGDSIREINKRTGAHVEIDRNHKNQPEGSERIFIIKGTDEQIEYAQQLIYEKITGIQGSIPPSGFFSESVHSSSNGENANSNSIPASASNMWGQQASSDPNAAAWAAYYQQYYTATAQPAPTQQAQATVTASSQPDYTQAWIDYYRSLGMHENAEQIIKQQQHQPNEETESSTATSAATKNPTYSNQTPSGSFDSDQKNPNWQNYLQNQNYANTNQSY